MKVIIEGVVKPNNPMCPYLVSCMSQYCGDYGNPPPCQRNYPCPPVVEPK